MTKLRNLIREMIKQELEEVSTTMATPGFQTPKAFKKVDDDCEVDAPVNVDDPRRTK